MRRIPLAFPIVVGTIGAILIAYASIGLARAAAASGWPTTQGIVLGSSLETEEEIRLRRQAMDFYKAEIMYSYTVGGKDFTSDKVGIDRRAQARPDEARHLVADYPPGKLVLVHYNPANPADAVLEPTVSSETSAIVGSGIALIVVAMLMILMRGLGRT
jgi:hypothetical protein